MHAQYINDISMNKFTMVVHCTHCMRCDEMKLNAHRQHTYQTMRAPILNRVHLSFLPVLCVQAPDAFPSELHNIHTHKPHTKAPNRRTFQYKITLISNSGSDCLFSLLNLFLSKTIAKYDGTIYRWHQFFFLQRKTSFFGCILLHC